MKLRPASPEALFNRALARQRLSLTVEAVKGWHEYLEHETDPGWIREAELAIDRLQAATASELWEAAKRDLPDLDESIATGDLRRLGDWLREHVHRYGRRLSVAEILDRAGCGPLSVEPLLDHLRQRLNP